MADAFALPFGRVSGGTIRRRAGRLPLNHRRDFVRQKRRLADGPRHVREYLYDKSVWIDLE